MYGGVNMIYAVIAAGGIGSRMGADKPKQYIEIGGKAIIAHTVEKFLRNDKIDKVIVLCPDEWVSYTKNIFAETEVIVISGGETRNETLMKAIDYIESTDVLDEDTYLVTHDAVRPFVTNQIINDNIDAMLKYSATGTVIPAVDTIFQSSNGEVIDSIPDRNELYQAQTPQCFGALKLRELYNSLTDEEKNILTDGCKIYLLKGHNIHLVEGHVSNIKITYPHDIIVAEAILKA
jgi:2-C-methyl-D-erythritol 4-phosphate cytidylyltransferase